MRRRLVLWLLGPLWWPLEAMASVGYVPSLAFVQVYVAAVNACRFVLDALLWIDRDGVSGS